MAFGSIELTTISRAQDYSSIKHNEDNKVVVDQNNFSGQMQKVTEQRNKEVTKNDDTQWQEHRPDAREKGNGQYSGDGGRNRKKQSSGDRMVIKGRGSFDMKI